MEELVDSSGCHDKEDCGHDSVDRPLVRLSLFRNAQQCEADCPLDRNGGKAVHCLHDEPVLCLVSTVAIYYSD